jgi:hypothetical protein
VLFNLSLKRSSSGRIEGFGEVAFKRVFGGLKVMYTSKEHVSIVYLSLQCVRLCRPESSSKNNKMRSSQRGSIERDKPLLVYAKLF